MPRKTKPKITLKNLPANENDSINNNENENDLDCLECESLEDIYNELGINIVLARRREDGY